ncbi:replication terminator protein [Clostridium sp. LBM24168]
MSKQINFETLAGGAFAERARQAIGEVMDNIADENTNWKDKRKVTLDLTFSTKEDREIIECDVLAKVKLAPKLSVHTKFLLDRNLEGEVIASEFKKQVSGQQAMKVDLETGEIIANKENTKDEKKADKTQDGLKIVK